ncbi:MAG: hypothetical protein A2X12_00755 [Bacteroidetes bacterium GWE2_29_8]|nr:MAG: hypothetical protein A2X12_00755 [Bacteroidetes bacterium GWE2_29_8]
MNFQRFSKQNIITNSLIITAYLLWNFAIGGIRTDHIFLIGLFLTCFYLTNGTRKFIIGFSIFIIYWIIYEAMRIVPNYEVSTVHIREPYEIEKYLFGITINNNIFTPNEYFNNNHSHLLDILSGIFYINWVPIPLAFGIYLFFKDKLLFTKFALVFFITNIIGFIIYYIYPAAPPWYVDLYGFDLHLGVKGNTAGLARFDDLIGIPIFANIYNKNANVLAAMPSLHSSYPVIVLFYSIKKNVNKWIINLFGVFMIGIWFSAVYSSHHYIIDVFMGAIIAVFTIASFEKLCKYKIFNNYIKLFVQKI